MNDHCMSGHPTLPGPAGYPFGAGLATHSGTPASGRWPGRTRPWSLPPAPDLRRLLQWRSFPSGSTVIPMSTPHPHSPAGPGPRPGADRHRANLARLRDGADRVRARPGPERRQILDHSAADPARRVLQAAIREVELHGWAVSPTPDWHGLAVSHGEYSVPVMLGRRLTGYISTASPRSQPGDPLTDERAGEHPGPAGRRTAGSKCWAALAVLCISLLIVTWTTPS